MKNIISGQQLVFQYNTWQRYEASMQNLYMYNTHEMQ